MFGIGMPELLLILGLALIVIGPKRLPDIAKALGKGLAEFRRATDELKNSFNEESEVNQTRERLLREGKIQAPGSDPELAKEEEKHLTEDAVDKSEPPKERDESTREQASAEKPEQDRKGEAGDGR